MSGDPLDAFRNAIEAIADLFRKEHKQSDYTLAGPGDGK